MNTHFFKSSYLNTDTENRRDDPRTHEKLPIEKIKIIYLKTYKHSQWNGSFSELMDIIEINLRLKSMELVYFWSLLLETVVQKINRRTKKLGQMEKYF